jgi:ABC-2 type transport system permease protein
MKNTFLNVLGNDYLRTLPRLFSAIMMTLVTIVSIVLAVYITGLQQVKGHIAIISQDPAIASRVDSRYLKITVLPKKPPFSDLIRQKYDAYITIDGNGKYNIETIRSDDFRNLMLALLENPNANINTSESNQNSTGVGVNITGFMMMFLLMLSFSNLFVFADDKEQGQLLRIAASPASFGLYLAAHCVYSISLLVPSFITLAILRGIGWNIGFSLPQYAGIMVLLGFFGISIALILIHSLKNPTTRACLATP